jgi:hypothetical protein
MPDWMMDDDGSALTPDAEAPDTAAQDAGVPLPPIDEMLDPAPGDQPVLLAPDTPTVTVQSEPPAAEGPAVLGEPAAPQLPPPPPPRTLRITFRRSRTPAGDRRLLGELLDLMAKYPGEDRFVIELLGKKQERYQLEFPSSYTHVCRELQNDLVQRLGPNCWQIEG